MENTIPLYQEELLQEARECLRANDPELDTMVDKQQKDYHTARTSILVKYMGISDKTANELLRAMDNTTQESVHEVQKVKAVTSVIQSDPYSILADQLLFEYQCFCRKHNIDSHSRIHRDLNNTIIFKFSLGGKEQQISFLEARILMNARNGEVCRKYFLDLDK